MGTISFVGNGFDIRHQLPTKFQEFMNDFIENVNNKNVFINYFRKLNNIQGWVDFEYDMLTFLELLSEFEEYIEVPRSTEIYQITKYSFGNTMKKNMFFDTICERGYSFFQVYKNEQITIKRSNSEWYKELVSNIYSDYEEIKESLNDYLSSVDSTKIELLKTSEIDVLRKSIKIYSFNYTNTLEKYDLCDINYVHGKLDSNIILGIPYSSKMRIKQFEKIFKTTQSIKYNYNKTILHNESMRDRELDIYFIGFSFGESDHYFFQELDDLIKANSPYDIGNDSIRFSVYYHEEDSKYNYINNFRKFLGESHMIKFDINNQINFIKYE